MHSESEHKVGAHRRYRGVLYQGAEVSGVYVTSVRCSPPEPRCDGLPLFATARGEINNPVQIVSDQWANRDPVVVHSAMFSVGQPPEPTGGCVPSIRTPWALPDAGSIIGRAAVLLAG
jgi:hypothetical protein